MRTLAVAAPALIGAACIAVSVALALPAPLPGRPATVLVLPGRELNALAALAAADPHLRLLGVGAGGLLLGVQYERPDLPGRLRGSGIFGMVGTGFVGCHTSPEPARNPSRLRGMS